MRHHLYNQLTFSKLNGIVEEYVEVFLLQPLYFARTGLKETFSWKLYLLFMILEWFWIFLIIAVIWSFNKSLLLEGHSKVFNVSMVSACLSKVIAISSFFTSKVSFLITSFELLVIFSFLVRIILESPWACLLEKQGLHSFQKGSEFFDIYMLPK